MKKRILSLLLAAVMVMGVVSVPVSADEVEAKTKFNLSVFSGESDKAAVEVDVDSNYEAEINFDDHLLDPSSVTLKLMMQDVDSLGVDEQKNAEFTFNTGLDEIEYKYLSDYVPALKTFTNAEIGGYINGKWFCYDVQGSYADREGHWVASTDTEETRKAWHELTSYVETTDGLEDDSKIIIKNGAYIAVNNECLHFEKDGDLVLDNLNNTDNLEQNIRDYVTLDVDADWTDGIEIYLPKDSTLKVSSSQAVLKEGMRIKMTLDNPDYDNYDGVLESMRDANGMKSMILTALDLVNTVLTDAQNDYINVYITTDSYEEAEAEKEEIRDEFWEAYETVEKIEIKETSTEAEVAEARKAVDAARAALAAALETVPEEDRDWYYETQTLKIDKVELKVEKAELKIAKDKEIAAQKAAAEKAAAEKAQKEAELATLKAAAATQNDAAKKVLALTAKATAKVTVKTSGTKVTATWDAVEGAEKYAVIVVKNGKEEAPVMVTETTYEVSAPGTKVAIIVAPVATFENVEYTGKEVTSKSVVVKPARPTVKVNKSGKKFKVTVKKASVTGYQIQTAKNSKFTKNLKKYTVKGKKVSKSYKLTTLKKGTNYVRVRAYKTISGKKYYSSWSKAVKVKR